MAACHHVLSTMLLGVLPPDWPPGGRAVQCAASLSALALFFGWLVPTAYVLQWHCQEHCDAAAATAAAAPAAAGTGGRVGDAPAAARAPFKQPLSLLVARNVFLLDDPLEFRCQAWACLALACWLAGTAWATGCRRVPPP